MLGATGFRCASCFKGFFDAFGDYFTLFFAELVSCGRDEKVAGCDNQQCCQYACEDGHVSCEPECGQEHSAVEDVCDAAVHLAIFEFYTVFLSGRSGRSAVFCFRHGSIDFIRDCCTFCVFANWPVAIFEIFRSFFVDVAEDVPCLDHYRVVGEDTAAAEVAGLDIRRDCRQNFGCKFLGSELRVDIQYPVRRQGNAVVKFHMIRCFQCRLYFAQGLRRCVNGTVRWPA